MSVIPQERSERQRTQRVSGSCFPVVEEAIDRENRSRHSLTPRCARRSLLRDDGFTLIELLVVITLIGIMLAAVAPALLSDDRRSDSLAESTEEVINVLTRARRTAVERAVPVTVTIEPVTKRWWVRGAGIDSAATFTFGDRIAFVTSTREQRLLARFDPRGPASADALTLRAAGRSRTVVVDRWTGVARVNSAGDARR